MRPVGEARKNISYDMTKIIQIYQVVSEILIACSNEASWRVQAWVVKETTCETPPGSSYQMLLSHASVTHD